nr:hypothetical protein GCM10010200_052390 [Actinomadura rugatobispora]
MRVDRRVEAPPGGPSGEEAAPGRDGRGRHCAHKVGLRRCAHKVGLRLYAHAHPRSPGSGDATGSE